MEIKINAYAIHTLTFTQYSPNNLLTAVLKITYTLGFEDSKGNFTPSVIGDRELTDYLELQGAEVVDFLSSSIGGTETLLDFTYSDLDKFLKKSICKKYGLRSLRSANIPGLN